MSIAQWDGFAPLAATVALAVFALWPDAKAPSPPNGEDWLSALEQAPDGQAVAWNDPATGQTGLLVPAGLFRDDNGSWCRHYALTVGSGAAIRTTPHLACRMARGGWREEPASLAQATTIRGGRPGGEADQLAGAPM